MGLDPGTGFCTGCFYISEGGMFAREINTVVQSAECGGEGGGNIRSGYPVTGGVMTTGGLGLRSGDSQR